MPLDSPALRTSAAWNQAALSPTYSKLGPEAAKASTRLNDVSARHPVVKAYDTIRDRQVAVKKTHAAQAYQEYAVSSGLQHTNVAPALAWGRRQKGSFQVGYLVMELVTPEAPVRSIGPNPRSSVRGALMGLAYLHSRRVTHGDPDSGNLLPARGSLVFVDWGDAEEKAPGPNRGYGVDLRRVLETLRDKIAYSVREGLLGADDGAMLVRGLNQFTTTPLAQRWNDRYPPTLADLARALSEETF